MVGIKSIVHLEQYKLVSLIMISAFTETLIGLDDGTMKKESVPKWKPLHATLTTFEWSKSDESTERATIKHDAWTKLIFV